MNKSLEYIKQRISTQGARFSDRNLSQAFVVSPSRYIKFEGRSAVIKYEATINGKEVYFSSRLVYDPNADYEYFTSKVSTHDGTLLFVDNTINECIKNIINVQTYNTIKGFPKELNGVEFTYTMGDIIVVNETDPKFAPADKPWMQERTTVMIPLIYSYKEKKS